MKFFKKFSLSDNTRKLSKVDWIIMGIMVLIYGIISFIRLGDTSAPNTYYTFSDSEDEVVVKLADEYNISRLRYYTGNNLGEIRVLFSSDGINYEEVQTLNIGGVFYWADLAINKEVKYIKFTSNTPGFMLGEP